MGVMTTRMSAEQRREQVLDATKAIVTEDGFHAVSIEAVARRAGITRPIVYSHFGDLHGLLEALVERESARALSQLEAVLPTDLGEGDPREILLAAQRGYLEVVASDPDTWRLLLMPTEGAPAILRERIAGGRAVPASPAALGELSIMLSPSVRCHLPVERAVVGALAHHQVKVPEAVED